MSDEFGQWDVDVNEHEDGVVLDFRQFNESGGQSFTTALPREQALSIATAILNAAVLLPGEDEAL